MGPVSHVHAVLLVDDDADTCEAMRFYLEGCGFTVTKASDGEEALGRMQAGLQPCALVLDAHMPVMNGWQLLARLRTAPRLAGIPVIMVSGYSEESGLALRLGVRAYFTKPPDLDALAAAVEEHCRRRPPA